MEAESKTRERNSMGAESGTVEEVFESRVRDQGVGDHQVNYHHGTYGQQIQILLDRQANMKQIVRMQIVLKLDGGK